jgi:hypothetical protein
MGFSLQAEADCIPQMTKTSIGTRGKGAIEGFVLIRHFFPVIFLADRRLRLTAIVFNPGRWKAFI